MRNAWKEDPQYIVNLTRTLIGEKALKTIVDENKADCKPDRVRSYILASVAPKIDKMGADKLGRICAYSSADGAHSCAHLPTQSCVKPKFINLTGLADVITPEGGYDANYVISNVGVGELLKEIAVSVLICVVCDIINQDRWQNDWDLRFGSNS